MIYINCSMANVIPTEIQERNWSANVKVMKVFRTDPIKPLVLLLEHHGLLTERFYHLLTDFFFVSSKDKN